MYVKFRMTSVVSLTTTTMNRGRRTTAIAVLVV
jgi:hypothetical protein